MIGLNKREEKLNMGFNGISNIFIILNDSQELKLVHKANNILQRKS
jgi:hypothetical protein